jgi:hypothetical protein
MSLGREIFVIHGRDKRARRQLFMFLRAIGLHPIEWTEALAEAGGGAPMINDILDTVIKPERAILVLLTPDDIAQLKPEHADGDDDIEVHAAGQARPNVLFEAGMAFGRHPENTVLVEFGKVRPFTDIAGRFVVKLDGSAESRRKLAHRLQSIGCEVNLNGSDWLSEGDLTPPTSKPVQSIPNSSSATASPRTQASTASGGVEPEFTSSTGMWEIEMENFAVLRRRSELVVHGEIINHEPSALMVGVKATFYDANGKPVGSGDGLVHGLGTDERKTFEANTYDKVGTFARVHVQVETAIEM